MPLYPSSTELASVVVLAVVNALEAVGVFGAFGAFGRLSAFVHTIFVND